jgi:hypothetical protein
MREPLGNGREASDTGSIKRAVEIEDLSMGIHSWIKRMLDV